MNILPQSLSIHGLLHNPTEQLIIPSYQRRYAWGYNQTWALFEDIDMLQNNDSHLFGMLILHTGLHHGGINTIDVVDGQQRITTITLLLNALRKQFSHINKPHISNQIQNLIYCGNDSSIPKLILGELDNKDFKNLLRDELDEVKNHNLLNAYNNFDVFINERLEEEGESWLEDFYNKLVHTAKIIRLDVQQARDAYKLFETINNRGLKLSATDILKNFILGHAAKISDHKLNDVKEIWSNIITTLDGIPTDDFFRQYICGVYTTRITQSRLIEYFKKDYLSKVDKVELIGEYAYYADYYSNEEITDDDDEDVDLDDNIKSKELSNDSRVDITIYLKEILNCAKTYAGVWNLSFSEDKLNSKLKDLRDIKSFPTYIFLMRFLQTDKPIQEKLLVLNLILILMLRRHICRRRTSENDIIFARILRIKDDSNFIETLKTEFLRYLPNDDEFENNFPKHEFKNSLRDRAKYILREINYKKTGQTGEVTINSGRDVQLEHIIPQNISTKKSKTEFGNWEEYLGEKSLAKHSDYVNKIGNMTLIAGGLNIIASNNPFEKKKVPYSNSNIELTKEISSYQDFKFETIENRGKQLAEIAASLWTIE
ncbi:DUF262 and DUF1524 domain-containing protein [Marivirga atlantica]|uniref:DUF262 domain-containing protein n=1 Tax=Marivirga atlantica TaxID=1548457 RepID=A0A937A5A7_9BACT|nr:DUF262 domain-containing protein [Marivirga atlantica]MBL0763897.1 DUF262 domain-containing protein [Marivirga atlantica]